jgi:hypothetical protein
MPSPFRGGEMTESNAWERGRALQTLQRIAQNGERAFGLLNGSVHKNEAIVCISYSLCRLPDWSFEGLWIS